MAITTDIDGLRTQNYTREELADILDLLAACAVIKDTAEDTETSVISTTSTSGVTTNLSATVTVESGDYVVAFFGSNVSNSGVASWAILDLRRATTQISRDMVYVEANGNTSGDGNWLSGSHIDLTPGTGSVTYNVYFKRNGGTAYVDDRNLQLFVIGANV